MSAPTRNLDCQYASRAKFDRVLTRRRDAFKDLRDEISAEVLQYRS